MLFLNRLYLIEILHQTTTTTLSAIARLMLYLIEILHQTTTPLLLLVLLSRCILSKFYIKPQQRGHNHKITRVVSYRNSTSNHNYCSRRRQQLQVVSYRNSTSNHNPTCTYLCYLLLYLIEILHQTTTVRLNAIIDKMLYLIEILHQTTTELLVFRYPLKLYLIEILHQTTT